MTTDQKVRGSTSLGRARVLEIKFQGPFLLPLKVLKALKIEGAKTAPKILLLLKVVFIDFLYLLPIHVLNGQKKLHQNLQVLKKLKLKGNDIFLQLPLSCEEILYQVG